METTQTLTPAQLAKLLDSEPSSQIVETKTLFLKTTPSKRTVAAEYLRVPRFFSQLYLHSYKRIGNPQARAVYESKAEIYRQQINNQMMNTSKEIEKLTNNWINILSAQSENGEVAINENYSNPSKIELGIRTPEERDFWQVVEQMDYLLVVMDNLWQTKELSITEKQAVTSKIVSQVNHIALMTERLAQALLKLRRDIHIKEKNAESKKNEGQIINTEDGGDAESEMESLLNLDLQKEEV